MKSILRTAHGYLEICVQNMSKNLQKVLVATQVMAMAKLPPFITLGKKYASKFTTHSLKIILLDINLINNKISMLKLYMWCLFISRGESLIP